MAESVEIKVSAKADKATAKNAADAIKSALGAALADLEKQSGKMSAVVHKELKSIADAFEGGKLAQKDVAGLSKMVQSLIEAKKAAGDFAIDAMDIHAALKRAAETSDNLRKSVRQLESDLESGSAVGEVNSGLSELDDSFAGLNARVNTFKRALSQIAQAFKASPIKAGIAGIAGAALIAYAAFVKWKKEMRDISAEERKRGAEDAERKRNNYYENRFATLRRIASLQKEMRDNAHAEAEAVRDIAMATAELEAERRKAGARSVGERNAIDNELARRRADISGAASVANINKQEAEDRARVDELKKEEATLREQIASHELAAQQAKNKEEMHYANTTAGRRKGGLGVAAVGKATDLIGQTDADFSKDEFQHFRSKRISEEQAVEAKKRELADKEAERAAVEGRVNSDLYDKKRKAAEEQAKVAKQQIEQAKIEQQREAERARRDRQIELEEVAISQHLSEHEETLRRAESMGGAPARLGAAENRLAMAQQAMADADAALVQAEKDQVQRWNAANPNRQISSISELDESEYSEEFKRERSLQEGRKRSATDRIRAAEGAIFDAKREGDEQKAQLLQDSMRGGSRLTALGLGGGDSPQKETAKNTKMLVELTRELVGQKGGTRIGVTQSTWSRLD